MNPSSREASLQAMVEIYREQVEALRAAGLDPEMEETMKIKLREKLQQRLELRLEGP